ncbi:MAG: RNA polymerase sigma factor [Candidatus Korobacteraceae bacterium]
MLVLTAEAKDGIRPSHLAEEVTLLFDEFRAPLLRYLLSCRLSVHDGEEIVQEVFLALFRHLQAGKPRQNLRGWIFRVAHNLALKRHNSLRVGIFQEHTDSLADVQSDPAPNPEQLIMARQRQQRLQAVVDALPERERSCLHLRAEGLRYREIAEVLGVSLGTVSMSLERALGRLQRADGA